MMSKKEFVRYRKEVFGRLKVVVDENALYRQLRREVDLIKRVRFRYKDDN